jgi:hypothetical protein
VCIDTLQWQPENVNVTPTLFQQLSNELLLSLRDFGVRKISCGARAHRSYQSGEVFLSGTVRQVDQIEYNLFLRAKGIGGQKV